MSILVSIGFFAVIAVAVIIGIIIGGAMNFRNFGSSGVALIGSGSSFAVCLTIAVASAGGPLTWVFAALAALIFGVIMRGAA